MKTRAPLLLTILVGVSAAVSCPPQYQLMEGRCIRPITLSRFDYLVNLMPRCQEACNKDGTHLPIIRNDQENDFFNNITNSFAETEGENVFLVLGLICNETTTRLQWEDGTRINYVPSGSGDMKYNCINSPYMVTSAVFAGNWNRNAINGLYPYTCLCVIEANEEPIEESTQQPPNQIHCGEYSLIEDAEDAEKPCFKVFTEPLSWDDAQIKCASEFGSLITINNDEENGFFWRTAVNNGMLGGMHIGARHSSKDTKNWSWIDGNDSIIGKSYDNFVGSFPIPGAGECASMATESVVAEWVNEDCKDNKLPFICRRGVLPAASPGCPKNAPKDGDDFFPPGYPNSGIACEYFLNVDSGKLVELEILAMAAAENVDFLEIYEGSSGLNLLANLTGAIDTPTKFTTTKSNVLRVNWKPNGSGDGKGFRIRYNEIAAQERKDDAIITTTNKAIGSAFRLTSVLVFLIMLTM
ncbi:hypothetical protein PRIPAC_83303 [Pristionchus pacificus]|uniref:CUB domain-containing protein n=1 Tax=Pristionchus pacificus TaxID=54126 RepID=A0A2A6BRR0_PRIPA|nr:hypothetical protein PRIPAC_83303 [Pristionchus pacificus]|eukprot:PDM68619.1 CUB domain-containing protein [Pristionchus pacificus]